MHKNAWKLTFSKMQNQQLFNEKTFFLFQISLRFYAINEENFHSDLQATYTRHVLQKLMQKDFFPSYWRNNKIFRPRRQWKNNFFFIYLLQNNATRKNDDKIKTKRMKRKLWLKAQIANRIRAQKCWKAIKTTPIQTLA